MCGIFGLITKPGKTYSTKATRQILENIAVFSESRGKDSSGMAIRNLKKGTVDVIKGDVPIRQLLKSKDYDVSVKAALKADALNQGFSAFGHARLVTNGTQLNEANNQPVLKDDIIIIHNGIIVNVDELWQQLPDLERTYTIDTEIIPALIRKQLKSTKDLAEACNKAFEQLEGTWSVAIMFHDLDQFVLATNNGSLYYITDNENFITFASEGYFLERLKKTAEFASFGTSLAVNQLISNKGLIVHLSSLNIKYFDYPKSQNAVPVSYINPLGLKKQLLENIVNKREVVIDPTMFINRSKETHLFNLLEVNEQAISRLRRCTKCLLPETFPFIKYDDEGGCNYCANYVRKNQPKNLDDLLKLIEPYRNSNGKPDCLVPFSGGRDSTFSLHFIKKELGLNPIAFTYDWGMVTDLARRNAARVCGKLGVENIIVAADIHRKRENIKKNVSAWLKRPHLGMVPLFMAGDKYFFYYSNKVLQQTGLKLSIWGSNPLENTDFKSGFTGIEPEFNKKRIDEIKLFNKLKLISFFGNQYLSNPSYVNSSLIDTIGSFKSRYITKRFGYVQLFDYMKWDENELENLILNEYCWEKSIDTTSTWRIGDGTAAFYNYIYHTVAGFSEFDTFRSNQIREGQLTREEGLELINSENFPRYENLRWYLAIIGLDFVSTIKRINKIPKLYNL
jgi:asparagine synthetase B (glutamine-hydrolysing)